MDLQEGLCDLIEDHERGGLIEGLGENSEVVQRPVLAIVEDHVLLKFALVQLILNLMNPMTLNYRINAGNLDKYLIFLDEIVLESLVFIYLRSF